MRDEAGILAMAGEGHCGFLHLSFQEYLAAEHAAQEGLARVLAPKAMQSWWREVALLSLRCSRRHCESFFREMLRAGIAENHPDVAQRCVEESLYFAGRPLVESLRRAGPQGARPAWFWSLAEQFRFARPKRVPAEGAQDARVAAILRLLRDRAEQVPELEGLCRRLADSPDQETRGLGERLGERLCPSAFPMVIRSTACGILVRAMPLSGLRN